MDKSGLKQTQTSSGSGQEQKQTDNGSGLEQEQTKCITDVVSATATALLHFSVSKRKHKDVADLIAAGASINSKDVLGRTALHFAIGEGRTYPPSPVLDTPCDMQIVKWLISHPAIDLNPVDHVGETPLMWAVKTRNLTAVNALLKRNANPDIANKDNRTPLHEALSALHPDKEIVFSLLVHVAGIYGLDNLQQTPVDIIARNVCNDETLSFAKKCVHIIALRYQIRKNLKLQLKKIPELSDFFSKCCEEVRQLKRYIIYDNVTAHDFALDCFQCRGADPFGDVYLPMILFLLSGEIVQYFNPILNRIPKVPLRMMLMLITGNSEVCDLLPSTATHSDIFNKIKHFYDKLLFKFIQL